MSLREHLFQTSKTISYITSPNDPDATDVDGPGGEVVHVGKGSGFTHTVIDPVEVIKKVWIPRAIIAVGVLSLATCMCTAAINSIVAGGSNGATEPTPISSPTSEVPMSGPNWAYVEIPKPSPTSAIQMQIVP